MKYIIAILAVICLFQQWKINSMNNDIIRQQEEARKVTVTLNNRIEELNKEREHEQKQADITINNLRKRVANGVHISTSVSSNSTTPDGKSDCKLGRTDAEFLISVAETADTNARKLNQCIDAYNAIRNNY